MKPGLAFECEECRLEVSATDIGVSGRLGDCSIRGNFDLTSPISITTRMQMMQCLI